MKTFAEEVLPKRLIDFFRIILNVLFLIPLFVVGIFEIIASGLETGLCFMATTYKDHRERSRRAAAPVARRKRRATIAVASPVEVPRRRKQA